MYGHILDDTVEFDLIADAILDDNVDAIHRLFQERRCGPLDWLVWDDGYGNESLFEVSRLELSLVHLPMNCVSEVVAAVY